MSRPSHSSIGPDPSAGRGPVLTVGGLRLIAVDKEARLYLGPRPWPEGSAENVALEGIRALAKDAHITAIFDLNADATEKIAAKDGGLTYRGIRVMDDGEALSPAILESTSRVVRELLHAGHRVYLHCTFGRGRSPTVAAAYLIAYGGLRATEARARIEGLDSRWLQRGIWCGYDARFPGRLGEFEAWIREERDGRDRE